LPRWCFGKYLEHDHTAVGSEARMKVQYDKTYDPGNMEQSQPNAFNVSSHLERRPAGNF